jgi:16S rRNA (guanine527-N7)-methyltransferase
MAILPTLTTRTPMDDARIAELLTPFLSDHPKDSEHDGAARATEEVVAPSSAQLRVISMYIDLILRWNARINLTAVSDPEEIVTRHFGESIFAARRLFPKASAGTASVAPGFGSPVSRPSVIDIGSGAGFPGLPIKLWVPHVHLTLIESNQKKATFLREVIRSLNLKDTDVFAGRADIFPGSKGDVVTLRAVEQFEAILPVAFGLVAPGGRLAMLVGERQVRGAREMAPDLKWSEPARLPLSSHRVLSIGGKEP